jgi:adenylate cyclase
VVSNSDPPPRTTPRHIERRLAAILHADVKGYSRLIGEDEEATLHTVASHLALMRTLVGQHGGRAVGYRGDSLLAEFPSAVEAVQCAVEVQRELKVRNTDLPANRRVEFRIGINLGEVVVEGEEIYGEGVNVAVRLEGLAEASGICIAEVVYDQVKNRLALKYEDLGEQTLKNIEKGVRVWQVVIDEPVVPTANEGVLRQAQHERLTNPVTLSQSNGDQKPRLGTARLTRIVLVLVGLLIVGGVVTILRHSSLTIRNPQSPIRNQDAQAAVLPFPDKPSIVVLPFVNLSGDPEQEYFSDGMTEDLITELAKLSDLFVIARNSAFVYKSKAVDVKEVSRGLGVRYVLEGSVRKAGDRVLSGVGGNPQLCRAARRRHWHGGKGDAARSLLCRFQRNNLGCCLCLDGAV